MNIIADELDKDTGKILVSDGEKVEDLLSEDVVYIYSTPILPEFLTGHEFIKY